MAEIEWVRKYCLGMAGATEQMQWGDDLVLKVGGKMFAVIPLEPAFAARRSGGQAGGKFVAGREEWPWLSFKTSPEEFAELTERPGVRPAAYLARAKWISIESEDALAREEVERLLRKSYELVVAKLPKRTQAQIGDGKARKATAKRKKKLKSKR